MCVGMPSKKPSMKKIIIKSLIKTNKGLNKHCICASYHFYIRRFQYHSSSSAHPALAGADEVHVALIRMLVHAHRLVAAVKVLQISRCLKVEVLMSIILQCNAETS